MKDTSRALKVSMIAAFAAALAVSALGCGGGQMGRAGDQVDRSASKTGKVFRGGK